MKGIDEKMKIVETKRVYKKGYTKRGNEKWILVGQERQEISKQFYKNTVNEEVKRINKNLLNRKTIFKREYIQLENQLALMVVKSITYSKDKKVRAIRDFEFIRE